MRTMKTIKLAVIALFSVLIFAGCKKEVLEVSLNFSQEQFELTVGEELDLLKELKVVNSNEKPVFVSLNAKVASVNANGKVVALAAGETKISASVADKSVRCVVKVADVVAESIALECPEELVADGESWATVIATVSPEGYNPENLKWEFTPNDDLLEFVYEKVSASEYKIQFGAYVENGSVTVKVSDKNSSVSKTAVVTAVEPEADGVPATRITLDYPRTLTAGEGISGTIKAVVAPEDYNPENLEWVFEPNNDEMGFVFEKVSASEYNISFATYVEGGKVAVTVTDVISDKFQVASISVEEIPVQGADELTLSPESLNLFTTSEPVSLVVKCNPEDYDNALLTWTSSDVNVVTVLNGVVTVVGEGEAVVKVQDSISKLEDEISVKVSVPAEGATISSITLSQTNLNMKYSSGAVQLTAECKDAAGNVVENYPDLVWSAEKMMMQIGSVDVVEVSQLGVVTPKNIGYTIITVVDKNNGAVKATCNVNVTGVTPTGIALSPASLVLPVGIEYEEFQAAVTPESTDFKTIVWTSSDVNVATVDSKGKVKTLSAGTTTITAATYDRSYEAKCKIVVQDMSFMLSLNYDGNAAAGLPQGSTMEVSASYRNIDGSEYVPSQVSWTSSNPALATVDANGVVSLLTEENLDYDGAEVVITHTADGESASMTIKILKALPSSLEITSYPADYKMYIGETFNMQATVNPSAAEQAVKWLCHNAVNERSYTNIDINTGVFTPQYVGYYSIEARSAYEYRDVYGTLHTFSYVKNSINVQVLPIDIQSATLSQTSLQMRVGNSASLDVAVTPSDATFTDFKWTSSDETVAKVNSNGIITAVAAGNAEITAKQEENNITLTCNVTVTEPERNFKIGDYYYEDGTISSEIISGKRISGVVCAVNDVTGHDNKLMEDHPSCSNGLVMYMYDASSVQWQKSGVSISDWAVENGFNTLEGAKSIAGQATDTYGELLPDGERMCGYSNTKAIKAFMASKDYDAEGDEAVYLFNTWNRTAPEGTSGWYVPSIAEWLKITENAELLQQKCEAIGGKAFSADGYWTSTEGLDVGSWAVYMDVLKNRFHANRLKSNKHPVRYVFAF